MTTRLRIFVTHPVQYHVPLWRSLAAHPALDVKVFYFSDHSVRGGVDKGFGVPVAWDVDLTSGYAHEFLTRDADLARPRSIRLKNLDGMLKRERPDWILISGYNMAFERQLVRSARKHDARVCIRAEFSDLSYGKRSLPKQLARLMYLRWFYSKIDHFCFPGEHGRRHLRNHGVPAARMFRSPYSVDDALIEQSFQRIARREARAALGISQDCFVLLFSGKLIDRKDPFAILEAISQLRDARRVGLIVLGDGELRHRFEPEMRALLGDRLMFPGFVNQSLLGRYFRAADCLVLPSKQETWGLVVNEAMHYGLPAIVSDKVGASADLVQHGVTGFTYPVGDNSALSVAVQQLVDDPARAVSMGVAARELMRAYTVGESARGVLQALGVESEARH